MFKAPLIHDEKYYRLQTRQVILLLLPSVVIGLAVNAYSFPWWGVALVMAVYLLLLVLFVRNQQLLKAAAGQQQISIDGSSIRILNKEGRVSENIDLEQVQTIWINEKYSIPQENFQEIVSELKGKPKQNYLILEQNGQPRRFDFVIDSNYMAVQLHKLIERWKESGYMVKETTSGVVKNPVIQ